MGQVAIRMDYIRKQSLHLLETGDKRHVVHHSPDTDSQTAGKLGIWGTMGDFLDYNEHIHRLQQSLQS